MRRFVIFGAVIAAVVLIWSGGWLYISNQIRGHVTVLGQPGDSGTPTLTCAKLDIGGYPFRFNATCAEATIVSGDVTVTLPQIEAAALIFQPSLYHVRAIGPATIEDAYLGGQNRVTWTNLEGSLRIADWKRIARLSLVGDNLSWSDTLVTETLLGSATRAEVHLVDVPAKHDTATGRATLEGYLLLDGTAVPAWAVADGDLNATIEVSNLPDNFTALPLDPIRDWQAAGGEIAVTEIKGIEGDDTITVTGNLKLNAEGFAEGTIDLQSQGIAERASAFLAPEMIPLFFGIPGADGISRQTFMIANGMVFLGMLPAFGIPAFF